MTHLSSDPLLVEICCECGIRFAMPQSFKKRCLNDSDRSFFCPNGHRQHYTNEATEREQVRRERDRLKQESARLMDAVREERDRADHEAKRAAGYKGAATRLKNRAKAGVCPCCNRHFVNLERHMKSQHTDVDLENVVELGQAATSDE